MTKTPAEDLRSSLRKLLDAVERGDLDAKTPRAIALRRRIEGAVLALDELAKLPQRATSTKPTRPISRARRGSR